MFTSAAFATWPIVSGIVKAPSRLRTIDPVPGYWVKGLVAAQVADGAGKD